ncbi:hypothetical protein PS3A_09610 [Pseudomonas sp. 3A(2025)]
MIDPVATVVQSVSPSDVSMVIADGKLLKRNGRLVDVDGQEWAAQLKQGWESLR